MPSDDVRAGVIGWLRLASQAATPGSCQPLVDIRKPTTQINDPQFEDCTYKTMMIQNFVTFIRY